MSVKVRLDTASATRLVLAKIGHAQRGEPLQTSRAVHEIPEDEQEKLTAIFLKPFKNLIPHRFTHHAALDQHELNTCARDIFATPSAFLQRGTEIARRLHAKSNHPNIKSGDLCIIHLKEIHVDGELVQGICILKSESITPFLTITARDGDLEINTVEGIHPEKIDKGCLIVDTLGTKGYYVLTFDRTGSDARFWARDFLGVEPIPDSAYLTNAYAKMAVSFLEESRPAEEESPPWETARAAKDALDYFEDRERFDLQEFEQQVLRKPETIERFQEHRTRVEQEQGSPLETSFEISQKDVSKAKKRIHAVLKLDTGVEIHVKPAAGEADPLLERGFDDQKGMKYIKVYYHRDLAAVESPPASA
jgi:hypothetical protein